MERQIVWKRVNLVSSVKYPLYVWESQNVTIDEVITRTLTIHNARFRIVKNVDDGTWEVREFNRNGNAPYGARYEGVWGCKTKKDCIGWMESYNERYNFTGKEE